MRNRITQDIQIRPFGDADIPHIARLHLRAFVGFANARLGFGYACSMLRWFRTHPHGIALAAWLHDQVVGYVVGAPVGYNRAFHRDLFLRGFLSFLTHPKAWFSRKVYAAIFRRVRSFFTRTTPAPSVALPEPAYSLVSIAVSPDARGLGIGQRLLAEFEAYARHRDARAIRLTTRPDNLQARSLYERCGWHCSNIASTLQYVRILDDQSSTHGSSQP